MVRKEDVYRAYVATCQAEGWPTRYTRQTLGKEVKRVFPLVSTWRLGSRHCVKQYYMGLCPQLQQQPQLRCWSAAKANNNNCGDCWVDYKATRQACSSGGGMHDCKQHLLRNASHTSPCQDSSGGGGDYDITPPTPDLSTGQDEDCARAAGDLPLGVRGWGPLGRELPSLCPSETPSAAPLRPLRSSQLVETSGLSSPSARAGIKGSALGGSRPGMTKAAAMCTSGPAPHTEGRLSTTA
jgi:hypothetical protein